MDDVDLDPENFAMGRSETAYQVDKIITKHGQLQFTTHGPEGIPDWTSFNGLGLRMRCLNSDGRVVSVQKYYQVF